MRQRLFSVLIIAAASVIVVPLAVCGEVCP